MIRRAGAELVLIALAFLAGLALAAWLESVERREDATEWMEEGR